jgi:thiamine biosynthesis protein ThiS
MKVGIEKIEVKEDKTVKQLVDELELSSVPVLLELDGEVFYPDEKCDKRLKRGDIVAVIRIVAGG